MAKGHCDICKKEFAESDLIGGHGIRHELEELIVRDHPEWNDNGHICKEDFNAYRMKYVSTLIEEETGTIRELGKTVLASIRENEFISSNVSTQAREAYKLGDRVSDKIASFGGSWKFIILFFVILMMWIGVNSLVLFIRPFDPFPFILLNLILSCLAAIQAPIIMMSQNRQEKKDRLRSESDYKINLKAEIEIRTLHEKVDHLLLDQWSKMMKIQELQMEMLQEVKKKVDTLT